MRYEPEIRNQAATLFDDGESRAEVARRLGIARSTSSAWHRLWKQDALCAALPAGRRPRLDRQQFAYVGRALLECPSAHGIEADGWSLHSVALLITRLTGERYHHRHVARLAQRMGWLAPPFERYGDAARFIQPIETPVGPLNLLLRRTRAEA